MLCLDRASSDLPIEMHAILILELYWALVCYVLQYFNTRLCTLGSALSTPVPLSLQNLIEKILRMKIYSSMYWKEHCFALTAESLVDKAVDLKFVGGTYGGQVFPVQLSFLPVGN